MVARGAPWDGDVPRALPESPQRPYDVRSWQDLHGHLGGARAVAMPCILPVKGETYLPAPSFSSKVWGKCWADLPPGS